MEKPIEINGVILSEDCIKTLTQLQDLKNSNIDYFVDLCHKLTSTILMYRRVILETDEDILRILDDINDLNLTIERLRA